MNVPNRGGGRASARSLAVVVVVLFAGGALIQIAGRLLGTSAIVGDTLNGVLLLAATLAASTQLNG